MMIENILEIEPKPTNSAWLYHKEFPETLARVEFDKPFRGDVLHKYEKDNGERLLENREQIIDEILSITFSAASKEQARAQLGALMDDPCIAAIFTAAASTINQTTEPPQNAAALNLPGPDPTGKTYTLYKDRPFIPGSKRRILATEHLRNEWQKYIDVGVLYMDNLRKLDMELVTALFTQESYERRKKGGTWKVSQLVPTRSVRADKELAELHKRLSTPEAKEAVRLYRLANTRTTRKHRENCPTLEPTGG